MVNCDIYKCAHNLYQKYLNVKGTGSFKEKSLYSDLLHATILLELIDLELDCSDDPVADVNAYVSEFEDIAQCEDCCDNGGGVSPAPPPPVQPQASPAPQTCPAPIDVNGYYPLYLDEQCANQHQGGDGTSHTHTLNNITYFMPNGLTMGVDQFHGNYTPPTYP
tara:strand:+ start:5705 stop:6196 length:492 start_codon:yes stop_codon:yes gene_type:complete